MTRAELIEALGLPAGARVEQRVPKKLLVENGAPTAADKRRISEGIEEALWLAALKPTTIGVPAFRDTTREYLEIAVLSIVLRPSASAGRLAELIHRAVPYPVILIAAHDDELSFSLAHKRWSQGETGATVLDGTVVCAVLEAGQEHKFGPAFVQALPISCQPRGNLYELYQGWMDTVLTLLAAPVTGKFKAAESAEHAAARRHALAECARLETEMAAARAAAGRERQVSRRVALNQALKRMQDEYSAARANL